MDVTRIRHLAQYLRADEVAPYFDMDVFMSWPVDRTSMGNLIHQCGTVACIAGHAAAMAEPGRMRQDADIMGIAQDYLGLTFTEAKALFLPKPGIADNATASEAADVLDRLADTGEVSWT